VLVPCMIQRRFHSRFQYLKIDIVEQSLSISISISGIVKQRLKQCIKGLLNELHASHAHICRINVHKTGVKNILMKNSVICDDGGFPDDAIAGNLKKTYS
jgi:hypothetical protein